MKKSDMYMLGVKAAAGLPNAMGVGGGIGSVGNKPTLRSPTPGVLPANVPVAPQVPQTPNTMPQTPDAAPHSTPPAVPQPQGATITQPPMYQKGTTQQYAAVRARNGQEPLKVDPVMSPNDIWAQKRYKELHPQGATITRPPVYQLGSIPPVQNADGTWSNWVQ